MNTQQCMSCGAPEGMLPFVDRDLSIDFKHVTRLVPKLTGWACQVCGEMELDGDSAERYAAAGDQLLIDVRQHIATDIKRIRRKLHLSQKDAVRLLSGGGHNAFSRYERADVSVPQPLYMLMRLLDRHPHLMQDVRALSEAQSAPATRAEPPTPLRAAGN